MSVEFSDEVFSDVYQEIQQLMQLHWLEVNDAPEIPLDVDWERMLALDSQCALRVQTARSDGKLVGYIVFVITPLLHYRSILAAHDDAYFLHPDHRKGTTGIRMFKAAETMLAGYGVQRILYHEKRRVESGKVFQFLGYQPIETIWSKNI